MEYINYCEFGMPKSFFAFVGLKNVKMIKYYENQFDMPENVAELKQIFTIFETKLKLILSTFKY